jgi:hypothetical protein
MDEDDKVTPSDLLTAMADYRSYADDLHEQAQRVEYDRDYYLHREIERVDQAEKRFGDPLARYVQQEIRAYLAREEE